MSRTILSLFLFVAILATSAPAAADGWELEGLSCADGPGRTRVG